MAESKEELKSLLMKVKEESEKYWLKTQHSKNKDHGIWSHHFMMKMGKKMGKMETLTGFIFLGSKITIDGVCSHEIKRCLLLRIKAMTNLDSMLKSMRHHFAKKDLHSQSYSLSSSHVRM